MRKIILSFLLFISLINITYAIPIPALAIGYDFFIFLVPFVLTIFTTIFLYFRKYIFWINVYFFILAIFLYFFYYNITKEFLIFNKEYFIFIGFGILLGLIYKFKKVNFLNYFLIILFIILIFFLIKQSYILYNFNIIINNIKKYNYTINDIMYHKNYLNLVVKKDNNKILIIIVYNRNRIDSWESYKIGNYYIYYIGNDLFGIKITKNIYSIVKNNILDK